jgi:hypothetical protein
MRVPRVRFTVRWLTAAVAFVAILLSLPRSPLAYFVQSLAVFILVPAGVAPTGHRVETAYWAMVLHPPLCVVYLHLIWVAAWCLLGHRPLPADYPKITRFTQIFLDVPYMNAQMSVYYLPIFAVLGWALAVRCFPRPSVLKPLKVLPVTWLTTLVAVKWDPFNTLAWFWD